MTKKDGRVGYLIPESRRSKILNKVSEGKILTPVDWAMLRWPRLFWKVWYGRKSA